MRDIIEALLGTPAKSLEFTRLASTANKADLLQAYTVATYREAARGGQLQRLDRLHKAQMDKHRGMRVGEDKP